MQDMEKAINTGRTIDTRWQNRETRLLSVICTHVVDFHRPVTYSIVFHESFEGCKKV